ncbi:N-acetyl sugar amidotransferase [Sediminibacterium sp.]|uniref:N-acetyl sugar amidotransferase n=1 Tax=Sediminibacterium sp. TaxID=1917865 RepID=UPI0025D8D713|nr:N-acetyl sugar amidotransferase [Sediminibacterium sp.]
MIEEYRICSKCVMDTTDMDITFNEEGVCNHCVNYDLQMSRLPQGGERDNQLKLIVDKIRNNGKGNEYDCIIGLSGGVDSTYVAYYVKKILGLRPLAVHLDNGWNSELSVMNIENIVKTLDIDLFTYVMDWEEFKDIQLSFLKCSTPDSEIPTDHAIFTILRKISKKYKVDYVINGINLKTEGHHPLSWSQGHIDFGYIKSVHKLFGSKKIKTFPHGNIFTIFEDRLSSKWVNILNYIDYNKEEAKKLITSELGWRDYGGKHFESIYTRFYQGYILPKKFNIDKRKMHFSSLICAGEMTREKALEYLKEETYPKELQIEDREYAIKKFGITDQEFEEIMNRPVKSYFDYDSYYGKLLKSKSVKKLIQLLKRFIK